jgi:hypothetical protein
MMNTTFARRTVFVGFLLALGMTFSVGTADAQFNRNWLSVGQLHNWYSEIGSEIEHGFVSQQQFGLRWPGIKRFQDSQAAKGLWLGARNVRNPDGGANFPIRVVHVGPRVSGAGEFFPVLFETVSRNEPSEVYVDGDLSEPLADSAVDRVDPNLPADRMIINRVNTLLGVTMERRILQFSQQWHGDYHVIEYTFTNTGKAGPTDEVTLPNHTVEDFVVFLQWRWSVAHEARYVIGNPTGWGMQTMIDRRGDGLRDDPQSEDFRAQFAWHGNFPPFTGGFSNLGGPIMPHTLPAANINAADTLGRLGASQFVGSMILHADRSATDPTDDWAQPFTRNHFDSDNPLMSQNSAFSEERMRREYTEIMTNGIIPRHAWTVEPTGDPGFIRPTGNPAAGTNGGYSAGNGFGPYTLAPGESVRIVIVEAVSGLSQEANTSLGRQYLATARDAQGRRVRPPDDTALLTFNVGGQDHSMTKNEWVFTSRDSLFQTFRRARAAYQANWQIPQPPPPPTVFNVNSGGNAIFLDWQMPGGASPDGFEIYRAQGRYDSTYVLVHTTGPNERSWEDPNPVRGIDYYYYLVSFYEGNRNTGGALTPPNRRLRSSRYFTQSYTPARLLRPAGEQMADVRIVPNPFHMGASPNVRWPDQSDKLGFLNIPGRATIQIFTELGELVDTITHRDGSGDAYWDHTTSSRQLIASGIYIAVITNDDTGERLIRKFVVIR